MSNTHAKYELTIKEFEAIVGTKRFLRRKGKRLEVKIPSGVKNGTIVRLSNALEVTDGCSGDILIQVNIAPVKNLDPTCSTNVDLIFQACLRDIGGGGNADIRKYAEGRSKLISRAEFFKGAIWAVWVSGMSRKSAKRFMNNIEKEIANLDFIDFGYFDSPSLVGFMEKLHGRPVPTRAQKKWQAIHAIAKWLSAFPSDESFRNEIFQAKHKGSDLDKTDANRLVDQRLPFIREANANYLVKNLGGEAIKTERWVKAFLQWGKIRIDELEAQLGVSRIPLGFFDTVFWSYCEMFIGKVDLFDKHFNGKFGHLKN